MITEQVLERKMLPTDVLLPNPSNPNKMQPREFDLLVDNITKIGFVDPVFCRPHPTEDGMFLIIGGHHRWEAAKYLKLSHVPVTITNDPEFDDEMHDMQLVRMNVIHGEISPSHFLELYSKYAKKYGDEVLQDMFGFAEEAQFRKLIAQTKKSLPKEMQVTFQAAAKELKTIDGLAKLLNSLFAKYGSTLEFGYMIVDFGGKDSVWVRASPDTRKQLLKLGDWCIQNNRSMDALLEEALQSIAKGEMPAVYERALNHPAVKFDSSTVFPVLEGVSA